MILLGLGSNCGDRLEYLARARAALTSENVQIIAASSIIETAALLTHDAPPEWDVPFLNQVLWVEIFSSPLEGELNGASAAQRDAWGDTEALSPHRIAPLSDSPSRGELKENSTEERAYALLSLAKAIEQQLGRQQRGHWAPREIDVDLLDVNGLVVNSPNLTLPHPQMHLRDFVLRPLAEIAPDWIHPTYHQRAAELLARLG